MKFFLNTYIEKKSVDVLLGDQVWKLKLKIAYLCALCMQTSYLNEMNRNHAPKLHLLVHRYLFFDDTFAIWIPYKLRKISLHKYGLN